LCLRSGARIRRADSLRSAARHLGAYMPSIAIVDLGLPDGSGLELVERLAEMSPRVGVILATSAEDSLSQDAVQAGADGFLAKPIDSLAAFQAAVLEHLPRELWPRGVRPVSDDQVHPDRLALSDDLAAVTERLEATTDPEELSYIVQFLGGLAKTSGDPDLDAAAQRLADVGGRGPGDAETISWVADTLRQRLPKQAI
jgi:DNA-binding response OmpR family regulator